MCMWDAQNKHFEATGRQSRGFNGYVYEISYGQSNGATAQETIDEWLKGPAHVAMIQGKHPWDKSKLDHFGCGVAKNYANCFFQQMIESKPSNATFIRKIF